MTAAPGEGDLTHCLKALRSTRFNTSAVKDSGLNGHLWDQCVAKARVYQFDERVQRRGDQPAFGLPLCAIASCESMLLEAVTILEQEQAIVVRFTCR